MQKGKGKQGTRGLKQILEENQQTLNFYFYCCYGSSAIYIILRYLLFWDSFSTKYVIAYCICFAMQFLSYLYMSKMATPVYDNNVVIDPGSDLNMQGHISEYLKDLILLPSVIYLLSIFTNYAWLLLLIVPIYAIVKLWNNVIAPWVFAPAPADDKDNDQKKSKEKRKVVRVR